MISRRSLFVYAFINTGLTILSYLQYSVIVSNNYIYLVLPLYTTLRNFGMISFIDSTLHTKQIINSNYVEGVSRNWEFEGHVILDSIVESIELYYFSTIIQIQRPIILSIVYFIPISFFFEIVLDFFYYWSHRGMHVYHSSFHKDHHTHIHLKSILAFYFHPIDSLLTIVIPFIITYHITNYFYILSLFELCMLSSYKIFIEISGHTGYKSYPRSSFIQFTWLPRYLGIEAYTENHNIHHTNPDYNFSKRFTLWDKVFGTHKEFNRSIE